MIYSYWCCCWCGTDHYVFYFISKRTLLIQRHNDALLLQLWITTSVISLQSLFLSMTDTLYALSLCEAASVDAFGSVFSCVHVLGTQTEHWLGSQREAGRGQEGPFQCSGNWHLLPREMETCCESSVIWSQADFTLWHLSLWVKWPL